MEIQSLEDMMKAAITAHQSNELSKAEGIYEKVLKMAPDHADANRLMGFVCLNKGDAEQALPFLTAAIKKQPSAPSPWKLYIKALTNLGQYDNAKRAIDDGEKAVGNGQTFLSLEKHLDKKRSEQRINPSLKKIENLVTLIRNKQFDEVLTLAGELAKAYPNSWRLHGIQGTAYAGLKRNETAIEQYEQALKLNADSPHILNKKGSALREINKTEEAVNCWTRAIEIKPNFAPAYMNLGRAFRNEGDTETALKHLQKAVDIRPNLAQAHVLIGKILKENGDNVSAIESLNTALVINPEKGEVHRILSTIVKYTPDDKQFNQMKDLAESKEIEPESKHHLMFGLAKAYEDTGEYEKSFHYYLAGNKIQKDQKEFKIEHEEEDFLLIKRFQPIIDSFAIKIADVSQSIVPIFIVGMPRSGTSLIEQIVCSHSEVFGAGELSHVVNHGLDLCLGKKQIDQSSILNFRENYLAALKLEATGYKFISDKMPHNFRFLPLICAAFPEARIVNVKRDAKATCWSNFKQHFPAKGLAYSHNLDDIVRYFKIYKDLIQAWEAKYSARVYTCDYDQLTSDPEAETIKLINGIKLDWQASCLSPHENPRTVFTASQQQVREEIYSGSSKGWEKFKPYLRDTFEDL